jgi:hypothetical protein
MVAASGIVLSTSTPFPGVAALLPTIGSALVIAGGFRQSALAPGRWLSTAIPGFLGRISYSLYLWHWPLLILPAVALDRELPWWARGALVLVAIGLAAATQRWVEDPLRHGRGIGTIPRRNLAMAGALSIAVATVSLGIGARATSVLAAAGGSSDLASDEAQLDKLLSTTATATAVPIASPVATPAGATPTPADGTPSPAGATPTPAATASPTGPGASPPLPATAGGPVPAGLRPSLAAARDDKPATYDTGCHASQEDTVARLCVYGDETSPTTVVLIGDSHAASWFPAAERLATERGWRLLNLTKSGCAAIDVGQWNSIFKREYSECDAWRESAFRLVEKEHPALVLMSDSRLVSIVGSDGVTVLKGAERTDAWRAGAARTLRRLARAADHVAVIGDTPRSIHDVPVCLSDHPDDILACATPFRRAVDVAWRTVEATAAERAGAAFVDPAPWVCPSDPCPPVIGKFMVLRDEHHLSTPFATALTGRLEAALAGLLPAP